MYILFLAAALCEIAATNSDSLKKASHEAVHLSLTHPLYCHALLSRDELCFRANTILYYIEANRLVCAQHK